MTRLMIILAGSAAVAAGFAALPAAPANAQAGNAISEIMALMAPPELLGIHTNMPAAVPADISKALASSQMPTGLSADEQNAFQQLGFFYSKGLGYANEMGLRPQTLYGIEDSPIGLAAWMLDHDARRRTGGTCRRRRAQATGPGNSFPSPRNT